MAYKVKKMPTPRRWRGLSYHPLAELIEFGVGIDMEGLTGHMQQHGYDKGEPIVLFQGKILDGRHKHSAAQKAEVEPVFVELVGTEDDASEYVRKKILRQHLDTSQRAMIAAKLVDILREKKARQESEETSKDGPAHTEEGNGAESSSAINSAAEALNVGTASVDRARLVEEHGSQAVKRAVRTGQISVTDAAAIMDASHAMQDKCLDDVRLSKAGTLAEAWKKRAGQRKKKAKKLAATHNFKDKEGTPIPERCRDAWADPSLGKLLEEVQQAETFLADAPGWIKRAVKLGEHYPFLLLEKLDGHLSESLHRMQCAVECVKNALPHAVCPKCKAEAKEPGKVCRYCRGAGLVPEFRFRELTNGEE